MDKPGKREVAAVKALAEKASIYFHEYVNVYFCIAFEKGYDAGRESRNPEVDKERETGYKAGVVVAASRVKIEDLKAKLAEQAAEIARLRAALKKLMAIAPPDNDVGGHWEDCALSDISDDESPECNCGVSAAWDAAREALAPQANGEDVGGK